MSYALHENMNNNAAKFAFFYMLSLVALLFTALSTGMIVFQIINKYIVDVLNQYSGSYSDDALKFGISAVIIATPIFYITSRQIYKSLFSGELEKDSGVRRWLTYFILLVSSVVMIGWLIATVNGFLDGELSTKFILKALTAIGIAGIIFSFYLYDIKREEVQGKKDKVISIYFYATLVLILAAFIGSLFTVESPMETRKRKMDQAVISDFYQIESQIQRYYDEYGELPTDLEALKEEYKGLRDEDLEDDISKEKYVYNLIDEKSYELCANFRTSTLDDEEDMYYRYIEDSKRHDVGYQCLKEKIYVSDQDRLLEKLVD